MRTIFGQSVAEHSWGVATLVLELWPESSAMFIKACLHHDTHEGTLGDMPWDAKRKHYMLADAMKAAEDTEEVLMGLSFVLSDEEKYRRHDGSLLFLTGRNQRRQCTHDGTADKWPHVFNGIYRR